MQHVEAVNRDLPRLSLDHDAFMRKLIEPLALVLERRVHGRNLLDPAPKRRGGALDHRRGEGRHRALRHDLALRVTRRCRHSEQERRDIVLVGVQQIAGQLGRIAEADGQQPAREPIETSGMAGLARPVEALDPLECLVRAQPDRLVQYQNSVDRPSARFSHHADFSAGLAASRVGRCGSSVDQRFYAKRSFEGSIMLEQQTRKAPQTNPASQPRAQKSRCMVQRSR